MWSFLALSTCLVLAAAVAVPYATTGPFTEIVHPSLNNRAPTASVPISSSVGSYMWNYAKYTIDIGIKGPVGTHKGQYAPIRLSGIVGTNGSSMTGTGFILEAYKDYPHLASNTFYSQHSRLLYTNELGYKSLLYDYQSLRPTMSAYHPPLSSGHAEEYLRDIEVDKEIRNLSGVSHSVKEYIIDTRHFELRYGIYDGVLPDDISEEDTKKAKEVYARAATLKVQRGRIAAFNRILDNMIKLGQLYGKSGRDTIDGLQQDLITGQYVGQDVNQNVIVSFLGYAVKPRSRDGVVRSSINSDGVKGEIVMWSEGLSLWMNLRLESTFFVGDKRAVDTGNVKLFTLDCSGEKKPLYCDPNSRGVHGIRMGRFTRFATAFY